ncbi:MAG: FAD-dependent oxidoreductase [Reyranella sp.]|nr:FAD-dependent oxidoreductase [Reyranella sp.]MDP2374988.1 FAD-dependent oxidoreductase [Reyranella sp.]
MTRRHAIVVGGSMAGLGAARALANHFDRVTLVERDELTTSTANRKGTPQAQHAHGLLASGYRILSGYFPKMMDELVADGAMPGDLTGDFLWYQYGGWKLRSNCGLEGIVVSRPHLERKVRERVLALPKITLLQGHDGKEPVFDPGTRRVTGLRVRNHSTGAISTLDADLVVDALGRGSSSPKWLASWGYGEVTETNVPIEVGYATGVFERHPGDLYGSIGAVIAGTAPQSTRYAAILGAESNRWIITLAGCLRDYPPTDFTGWKEFARTLPTPDVVDLVKDRAPIGPIVSYRFPANRHRHYEKLKDFPDGYLVMGDAVCSFNPIYGQGMSVALTEARALDGCLAAGDDDLAKRFFREVTRIVANPWAIATGEDYRYPKVEGRRPPGFTIVSRYMERAHRAATKDAVVLRRFFEVASLLAPPPSMMAPGIAWRVFLGGGGVLRKTSPARKATP